MKATKVISKETNDLLYKLLDDYNESLLDVYSQMNNEELNDYFNKWKKDNNIKLNEDEKSSKG